MPRKRGFSECMGAMLANHHHPYIQRGYREKLINYRKGIASYNYTHNITEIAMPEWEAIRQDITNSVADNLRTFSKELVRLNFIAERKAKDITTLSNEAKLQKLQSQFMHRFSSLQQKVSAGLSLTFHFSS